MYLYVYIGIYSSTSKCFRSPRAHHADVDLDKKRTVNFPESLMSLPQRLENIIAEQQRRLDRAIIDTSGRASPPRASQSLPHLATTSSQPEGRGYVQTLHFQKLLWEKFLKTNNINHHRWKKGQFPTPVLMVSLN